MKKHKACNITRIIAALLAVTLLAALSSCKVPEDAKTTEQTAEGERVGFATFKKSLGELIDAAGVFEMTMANSSKSDDTTTMYVFDITQDLVYSQERITLFVYCNSEDTVTSVSCRAKADVIKATVALINYYVYKSIGLSEMDADAFYGTFGFFEDEPVKEYEKEENGWVMEIWYQEDSITFHAMQLNS